MGSTWSALNARIARVSDGYQSRQRGGATGILHVNSTPSITDPNTVAAPSNSDEAPRRSIWWQTGIAFIAALTALVIANQETLHAWVMLWIYSGHELAAVMVAASIWLIWRSRADIASYVPEPTWRGVLLAIPVGVLIWIACLADVRVVQLALFIASIAILIWTIFGFRVLRAVSYPIALLVLALPIWNYFKPVLQYFTVQVTALALQSIGVPVSVDDTFISTPQRTILVVGACSGVQFFQAGLMLGALHAGMNFRSSSARVAVIVCFATGSILGNWTRVLVIISLGQLTEFQHGAIGWAVFALFLVPSFLFSAWLERREIASREVADRCEAVGTGRAPIGSLISVATAATLVLAVGPLAERAIALSNVEEQLHLEASAAMFPWTGPHVLDIQWRPIFHGADAESLATYRLGYAQVTAYRAYYAVQRQNHEAVNELNRVFDDTEWNIRGGQTSISHYEVLVGEDNPISVIETRLQHRRDHTERLVWYWYQIAGRRVASPWQAKVEQVLGAFRGRRDAVVVALSADATDVDEARKLLAEFLTMNYAVMHTVQPTRSSQVFHEKTN